MVNYFKKEYLNQTLTLDVLDTEITKIYSYANSILDYDLEQVIKEGYICYEYEFHKYIRFWIKLFKEVNTYDENTVVKITDIELV